MAIKSVEAIPFAIKEPTERELAYGKLTARRNVIVQIRDDASGDCLGALADHAGVRAEQQHGADIGPRLADESLDLAGLQLHCAMEAGRGSGARFCAGRGGSCRQRSK